MKKYLSRLVYGENFLEGGISFVDFEKLVAQELRDIVDILETVQDCIDAGSGLYEAIDHMIAWRRKEANQQPGDE
jgi:hypothetical protein